MERAKPTPEPQLADLVERHTLFLFRVAYACLRHSQDAEDTVQDAFLKLFRTGGWRHMQDERAFLGRIVWRLALDRRRRRGLPQELPDELASAAPSVETVALAADNQRHLHQLIQSLPDDLRQPLVLSTLEEMSSAQIGHILDLPDATVRNRLLRARQLLREKWSGLHHAR